MITAIIVVLVVLLVLGLTVAGASIRVLREYERGVVFRLGRLMDQRGPGLVLLVPSIDRMVRVSLRTVTLTVPAQEVITRRIRRPITYVSHREFVRGVLRSEVSLGADGMHLIDRTRDHEPERTRRYRSELNREIQPSNVAAAGWTWQPGGELAARDTGKRPDASATAPEQGARS